MNTIQAVRALGPIDLKNIRRDPLLRYMVLFPLLFGFLLRWGLPWLSDQIFQLLAFDLMTYRVLIVSVFSMLIPVVYGSVIGFLLLDQRDDHTITALQVTPLTLNGYFFYRMVTPVVLGLLGNLVMLPLSGMVSFGFGPLFLVSLSSALLTPLYALFYAGFAENKVQGFALMKISGIIFMPAMGAYFVPGAWAWAFAVLPPFWPMKLTWVFEFQQAGWWWIFLVGAGMAYGVMLLLLKRFKVILEKH